MQLRGDLDGAKFPVAGIPVVLLVPELCMPSSSEIHSVYTQLNHS